MINQIPACRCHHRILRFGWLMLAGVLTSFYVSSPTLADTESFTVEFVNSSSQVQSIATALSLLDNAASFESTVQQHDVINFGDRAGMGNYSGDTLFPYGDRFAVRVQRDINVEDAGTYTLGVNSDDGVRLLVDGEVVINDDVLRASTNSLVSLFLSAGLHSVEVVYFENDGGASLELFAAPGSLSAYNGSFALLSGSISQAGNPAMPASEGGVWEPVMDWPLVAVSMANLPDGRILTYSGSERRTWPVTEQTYSATWDPISGQFGETLHVGHNMFCAATSMTQDGKVFVNGGRNQGNSPWTSIFDSETSTWQQIENMASGGRWYPTSVAMGDGSIFTAMGISTNVANPDLWNADEGWRVLNGINFLSMRQRNNQLGRENVFPLLSQAPNGDIYHFWDTVENHYVDTQGNGSAARTNADSDHGDHEGGVQTVYDEGKLLISGNNDGSWGGNSSVVTANAFTVDLNVSPPVIRDTQPMKHRRKFHQLLPLPTGEVLVVGGNTTGSKFQDNGSVFEAEIWNPDTGQWRVAASMTIPRDYHSTALLMVDGRVITAGGGYHPSDPSSGGTHQDAQIYSPAYLYTSDNQLAQRPTVSAQEKVLAYGQTFTVNTSGDIAYFSLIKMSSTTHAVNTDNRHFRPDFFPVSSGQYAINMHENPNVATPGYWMLFAVDSDGVPSIADVIRVALDIEPPVTGEPPVLEPIVSAPLQTGANQSYSVAASGDGLLSYSWNFGDGSGDSAATTLNNIEHSFSSPGRYVVTVTVTDSNGLLSRESFVQMIHRPLSSNRPVNSAAMVELEARNEIWVVNPDNNSVTGIGTDSLSTIAQITVGEEPRAVAVAPDGRLWVVNKGSANISIINPASRAVVATVALDAGSLPHGIVFGNSSAYVALEGLATVVQLNDSSGAERRRSYAGETPRHLSLNANASRLYVSNFITPPINGEDTASPSVQGAGGEVRVFDTSSNALALNRLVLLSHIDRDASENAGPGIPNYLGPAVVSPDGTRAWIPSKQDNITGGPLRNKPGMTFDQTVRAVTSTIDLAQNTEVLFERIDHDNASVASHAAFGPNGLVLFTSLEGNRQVSVIDTSTAVEVARFDTGRAPQSVLLSADGTRLYVHNFMDRSVGVYDVSDIVLRGGTLADELATVDTVTSEAQLSAQQLRGKQLFYDARDDRLAALDYMSCASCHNEGGHDGRTWDFTGLGEGLRNTISLIGAGGLDNGLMHWSANFDEIQDFEGQIREFAGGTGLMSNADFQAGSRSDPLGDPKAGLSSDLDALAAYLESLDVHGPSPYRAANDTLSSQAQNGRQLFADKGCASCHIGERFTDSGSSPDLHDIGTLQASSGSRSGGALNGIDTPSLLSAWRTAPYLHNGSAATINAAIAAHNGINLTNAERADISEFVLQLSESDAIDPPVEEDDNEQPVASLTLATTTAVTTQSFEGIATDTGGSGLLSVTYLIRDLSNSEFVSPTGTVDSPRIVREATLQLSSADQGTWQLDTTLPDGRYRFYFGVRDNNGNINQWVVRETFDVTTDDDPGQNDDVQPVAVLTEAVTTAVTTQSFSGTASDTGGSGLLSVTYLIRDLGNSEFVDPTGAVDSPRVIREASLQLSSADEGTWQLDTTLPDGRYRLYVGVRDNNGNINQWVVRETYDVSTDDGAGQNDDVTPNIALTQAITSGVANQTFSGTASDSGGSGLLSVTYLIRDLSNSEFVSPTGEIENPRIVREASLTLDSADEGIWQLDTTLPDGRYKVYFGVRDNNGNINQWPVRPTYDVTTEDVVANGG